MTHIKRYIEIKGITQKEFSVQTGIDYYQISRIINGSGKISPTIRKKIIEAYPDFDEVVSAPTPEYLKPLPVLNEPPVEYGKKIPFYDVDVYATISPAMSDMVTLRPSTFINIPMFSQGEYAVQVTGHSMKGYINHGDWIVVKRIINRDAIIYGEPYLVVTKTDNLKTVKFVKPSQEDPDSLCLIPYNIEQFEEQDLPKDEILELYRVVGLFRVT